MKTKNHVSNDPSNGPQGMKPAHILIIGILLVMCVFGVIKQAMIVTRVSKERQERTDSTYNRFFQVDERGNKVNPELADYVCSSLRDKRSFVHTWTRYWPTGDDSLTLVMEYGYQGPVGEILKAGMVGRLSLKDRGLRVVK